MSTEEKVSNPKVQRILEKYPYGLTYKCYLELKFASTLSNKEIAVVFNISLTRLEQFVKSHKQKLEVGY